METTEALKLEEELLIDPETGEITGDITPEIVALPNLARTLRALMKRAQMIEDFRAAEMNRINECCQHKLNQIYNNADRITEMARVAVRSTGEKKVEYPGIGFFRFGTTRESIDDSEYQDMTDDEKKKLWNNYQGCFRSTTTTKPDKKWIKGSIESGSDVPGFTIKAKEETFTFHKED